MHKIVERKKLAEDIFRFEVEAPEIARKRKVGQFVVVRLDEKGERIPLTVVGADKKKGRITLIFQAVGETTAQMARMKKGEYILDLTGPLGLSTQIKNFGGVVCVGGGLGIALVYPIARAMKEAGNRVISVISARGKDLLIMRKEMEATSDRLEIATDDGSLGYHGFPTGILRNMIEAKEKIDLVVAVGPVPMMRAISEVTKPLGIETIVSLNPIMVDGTGMCGGCRVTVGGKTKFTCVDGPEFDGHEVDFEELARRLAIYDKEKKARKASAESSPCILQTVRLRRIKESSKGRIPRQKLTEQEPKSRIKNFREVASGYTPEQAFLEAKRCLQCKKSPCQEGCPVEIDIPAFIQLIIQGDYRGAARKIKEESSLPAVCGRVCPAEDNCEKNCVLGKKGDPVAIGSLERFVLDRERELSKVEVAPLPSLKKGKVAIIGSGPAGISAAGDLAKLGYRVTIFEAFHKAGGVLVYGIPEFRLPKAVVEAEVDYLRKLGGEN